MRRAKSKTQPPVKGKESRVPRALMPERPCRAAENEGMEDEKSASWDSGGFDGGRCTSVERVGLVSLKVGIF